MTNLDAMCMETLQRAPRAGVAWFLMASFLYYHRDVSILSDPLYDWIGKTMALSWGTFDAHPHAHLITPADLQATTLYRLKESEYPTITKDTAEMLARRLI